MPQGGLIRLVGASHPQTEFGCTWWIKDAVPQQPVNRNLVVESILCRESGAALVPGRCTHTHTHHEADRSELDQKPRKTWQLCVEDVFDFHLPERQVNHRLKHQNSGGLRHFDLMVPRPLVMKDNSNMFSH